MIETMEIELTDMAQATVYMTAAEYERFAVKLQEQVGPELDQQREARMLSEEAAKAHLVR